MGIQKGVWSFIILEFIMGLIHSLSISGLSQSCQLIYVIQYLLHTVLFDPYIIDITYILIYSLRACVMAN
jgi:hypothetical protein